MVVSLHRLRLFDRLLIPIMTTDISRSQSGRHTLNDIAIKNEGKTIYENILGK